MIKLLFVLCVFSAGTLYGQEHTHELCGERFTQTSKKRPVYGSSLEELTNYLNEKISFRSEEHRRGIFQVRMNCEGQICEVKLMQGSLPESTIKEIRSALVEMPEWTPADVDGPVDYQFYLDLTFKGEELKTNTLMR